MIKMEEFGKMMNSENAPVIAGISGIVIMVDIDRITRSRYRFEGKKDSVTIEPAGEQKAEVPENKAAGKTGTKKKA